MCHTFDWELATGIYAECSEIGIEWGGVAKNGNGKKNMSVESALDDNIHTAALGG